MYMFFYLVLYECGLSNQGSNMWMINKTRRASPNGPLASNLMIKSIKYYIMVIVFIE